MEKRKKILFVITKAAWGGAQRYVYDLALAAREAGYEVVLTVGLPGPGGAGPLTEHLASAGIRVAPLPLRQRRNFFADLVTFGPLFSLIRFMREERPDIVHTNSAKGGGLGCLAARIAGVSCILFTAHGWEFNAPRGPLSRAGMRFFSWLTILLSHQTICVSDAIAEDVLHWPGVRARLTVIKNGVLHTAQIPRADARAALLPGHERDQWLGMVSELHPTKRIEDAIEAFALLNGGLRNPRFETILVIIGEGGERAKLEHLIHERGLTGRVFLLGFVANAEQYLSALDLFLHTSQSEALGYAILEAGNARLPVVATRVGGIPEIIEDGVSGLLVPPHAPRAIAAALEELLANPARTEQLGEHLYARVVRDFSQEEMIKKTLALYA